MPARVRGGGGGGGGGGVAAMAASSEVRRSLLQVLLSRKVMTKAEVEAALEKIGAGDRIDVRACLSELNKELRFSHFEIRGLHAKGTETYGIVNTVNDEVAKAHASRMKDWEKAFFKEVIKTLCENENEGMDKKELINISVAQGGTSASVLEKETTLAGLVSDMWLRRDHHGRVFLGPRTFLELGDIVRAHNLEPPQVLIY